MAATAATAVIRILTAATVVVLSVIVRGEQQPTFRAGVEVVRIDVSVMRGIVPVAGLDRDDFELIDNGVVQALDAVSLDQAPLNLMLVLDTSASLDGERLNHLIDATNELVRSLRDGGRGIVADVLRTGAAGGADDGRSSAAESRTKWITSERLDLR